MKSRCSAVVHGKRVPHLIHSDVGENVGDYAFVNGQPVEWDGNGWVWSSWPVRLSDTARVLRAQTGLVRAMTSYPRGAIRARAQDPAASIALPQRTASPAAT